MNYKLYIENYKVFSKKEIDLHAGVVYVDKKNSGKTTMLEALLLPSMVESCIFGFLVYFLGRIELNNSKEQLDYIQKNKNLLFNNIDKPIYIRLEDEVEPKEIKLKIYNGSLQIKLDHMDEFKGLDYFTHNHHIPLDTINPKKTLKLARSIFVDDTDIIRDITTYYLGLQRENQKIDINKYLKELFLVDGEFLIIDNKPCIRTEKDNHFLVRPLENYGKSVSKFILILLAIYFATDGYVCIDDIYDHFDKSIRKKLIEEIIPKIAKEVNAEVFSTASI